ncbi:MAG: hypothetical protein P4L43_03375 [Syntrophobacteraceae bacterium]|nr:hypothetical protein [Syntrophobacteraceae bacterium]
MKKAMLLLAVMFFAVALGLPAFAQENLPPDPSMTGRFSQDPPGEFILFDTFILRPLGLVAMGVGAVGAAASAPWANSSHSQYRVKRELLDKPYWYTFCRPLGDSDF